MSNLTHSLASRGFGSDRGQNEKESWAKILKLPAFDLKKRNIPLKKLRKTCQSETRVVVKSETFVLKN